jgi:hypothetical protein
MGYVEEEGSGGPAWAEFGTDKPARPQGWTYSRGAQANQPGAGSDQPSLAAAAPQQPAGSPVPVPRRRRSALVTVLVGILVLVVVAVVTFSSGVMGLGRSVTVRTVVLHPTVTAPHTSGTTSAEAVKNWGAKNVSVIEAFWNDLGGFSQDVSNQDVPAIKTDLVQLRSDIAGLRALPVVPVTSAEVTWAGLLNKWTAFTKDMTTAVVAKDAAQVTAAELSEDAVSESTMAFFTKYGIASGT